MRVDKCWSGGWWKAGDASRRRALSDMWAQLNRHNAGVVLYPVKIEQFSSCLSGVKKCAVGADGRERNKRTVTHRTKTNCCWLPCSSVRRLGATCCLHILGGQPNSTASYHRTLNPWAGPPWRRQQFLSWSRNSRCFTKPECSLPCSQQPPYFSILCHIKPDQVIMSHIFGIHCNIIFPSITRSSKDFFSFFCDS